MGGDTWRGRWTVREVDWADVCLRARVRVRVLVTVAVVALVVAVAVI